LLNEAELFIALAPEYLSKQGNIVVLLLVLLNAGYYGGRPLDYQVFQAVPLIKVGVHELLHCFSG
jgi:hypothetical protein